MNKKYYFIFCCLCVFCAMIISLSANKSQYQLTKTDCDEFDMCKEGLIAIINGETFTINKDTCLKYNKKWRDDIKACDMR